MKTSLFLLGLILGCVTATPAWMNAAGIDSEELEDPYDAEIKELEEENPYDAELEELEEENEENEENELDEEILEEMEGAMQSAKIQYRAATVFQGDTVGFQPLYEKRKWLGCPSKNCDKRTCPRLYMEGADWTSCWGEVFQIYRKDGPGVLLVGDVVGIFYPREKNWFSLAGGTGHKHPCPGAPTSAHGFSSPAKWNHCWGEVFQIYAKGKTQGSIINDGDHITLYYIRDSKWVGLVNTNVDLRTCPGKVRPPANGKYDECWGEIFELWKKP